MGGSKEESNSDRKSSSKKSVKFSSPAESGDGKESAERERKAELERKVRERVSLEARAFDVVNRLIEPHITQDYLLQACHFIDHSHYEDVVEERSISHLCGYPVCDNALPKMPKKKYHISTRSNTVYDITTRKKFCSNRCYNASEHLRKQIPQTPVWTRRGHEDDTFDLLQAGKKCVEGEEVIGVKMLSLKEEVTLLESLDRAEGGRSSRRSDLPLEDSQRLSDQLNALSTDHDLPGGGATPHTEDMAQGQGDSQKQTDHYMHTAETTLSVEGDCQQASKSAQDSEQGQAYTLSADNSPVNRKDGSLLSNKMAQDRKHSASEKQMGKLTVSCENDSEHAVLAQRERTNQLDSTRNDGDSKLTFREDTLLSDPAGLEKMKDLSIKDAGDVVDVDSDDDSDDNAEDKDRERLHKTVDGSGQTLNPVSSSTHAVRPGNVDSDDDEDENEKDNKSVTKPKQTDPVLKAPSSEVSRTHSEQPSVEKASSNPKDSVLKQQPGESKSAYLMRLLDHRKALLSKVADVQSSETDSMSNTERSDTILSNSQHTRAGPQTQEDSKPEICRDVSERKPSDKTSDRSAGRRKEGRSQKEEQSNHQSASPQSPVMAVCQVISGWVTPDTLSYLHVHPASQQAEDRDTSHRDPDMETKYQALCQRLAAKHSDWGEVIGEEEVEEGAGDSSKKPVPRFEELRKQTEQYQLQVQHFLQGPRRAKSAAKHEEGGGEEGERDRPVVLPVVDSHNQLLIRRRIVLERLDRTMPSLLPPLGLSVQDVSALLRELVFTFSLTSHNIVFKPVEWTLVAIILLNMMGRKSGAVKAAFESSNTTTAFNLVLARLGHSTSSLSLLVHDMLTQRSQALQS